MLSGLHFTTLVALAIVGVLVDLILGETRRWHPLVGFGRLAQRLERTLNAQHPDGRPHAGQIPASSIAPGACGWALAVIPIVLLAIAVLYLSSFSMMLAIHALLLYLCIGLRSLRDHTGPIAQALETGDLPRARHLTSRIVSRDTDRATATEVSKAAVESLLENGNDAVFGTLFWFIIAGGPGAVLFRLANTLDAMWGYRNARYNLFGRVAARIDDGLNWIPARLTALSYAALGKTGLALRCWRTQSAAWPSPNAGPVMATGAGALGLALGGAASYDGAPEIRPPLGAGAEPAARDIHRAWKLVLRATVLWLALLSMVAIMFCRGH